MIEPNETRHLNLKTVMVPLGTWATLAVAMALFWPRPKPQTGGYGLWFYIAQGATLLGVFVLAYWKPSLPLAGWIERHPIVKQLRAAVLNLQLALDRRSTVLAAVANFSNWTQYFIGNPTQSAFDSVNNSFVETVRDLFAETERIAIFAATEAGDELTMAYHSRFEPTRQRRLPIDDSAAGYCFKTGKTQYWPDVEDPDCPYRAFVGSKKIGSLLCIPLKAPSGKVHSVLSMDSQLPRALDKDTIELVEVLARQVAVVWSIWSSWTKGESI